MIRLNSVFQNGMILQCGKPITIFGESGSAQSVAAFLNDASWGTFTVDGPGPFRAVLPPVAAAEDATVRLVCPDGEIKLEQVDIGEVWVAGGQSNMEFFLRYDAEAKRSIREACDPHLRVYTVARYAFDGEEKDGFKDERFWGRWLTAAPEHAEAFPAVAYYFACELRERLHVPVGIVNCNWGGTSASTWLDEALLAEDPELSVYLEDYEKAVVGQDPEAYREADRTFRGAKPTFRNTLDLYGMYGTHRVLRWLMESYRKKAPIQPMGPLHHNSPGRLYHSMLSKIAGFSCRGVLWYQGESDVVHPDIYARLFTRVLQCWRRDWGEELPFLFVQLAPFDRDCGFVASGFPEIRRQQEQVERTVPDTWMTSIMDVGMRWDIHPKKKRPVGHRLALLARGKVYGEDILCQEPVPRRAEQEKNGLRLYFDHAGGGLVQRGSRLHGMKLLADGRPVRHWRAKAEGDCLCLYAPALKHARSVTVEFAQTPYCRVNLYNSAGLPTRPFITKIGGKS